LALKTGIEIRFASFNAEGRIGVEIRCGVFQRIEEELRGPEMLRHFRAAR